MKLLDITLDSVPVVLAMIYSVEKTPHLIVGAAAAETRIDAIKKAFCEAECGSLSYKKSVARRWNITGMAENPARPISTTHASEPPARKMSASPNLMIRQDSPIALFDVAQAVTIHMNHSRHRAGRAGGLVQSLSKIATANQVRQSFQELAYMDRRTMKIKKALRKNCN